jgi:glucosamine-6-phosphate deaminase
MRILVVDDPPAVDRAGADLVAGWLGDRPDALVVPALGRSALGIYDELGRRRAATGEPATSGLTLAQLDAYVGIGPDDPRSLYAWLLRAVAAPLGVPADRVLRLAGDAADPAAAARAHGAAIAARGGIDVAILGLGPNGHLGFNEPPAPADAPSRLVELTAASRASSATYFDAPGEMPSHALTVGMRELLAARRILLVVQGPAKRPILRALLTGPVTPELPGSLLRDVSAAVLLADRAAWPDDIPVPDDVSAPHHVASSSGPR